VWHIKHQRKQDQIKEHPNLSGSRKKRDTLTYLAAAGISGIGSKVKKSALIRGQHDFTSAISISLVC
jgi:hypothetical protein